MCRHGDGWRGANHLVLDIPFVVDRILLGEVERAGDDSHGRVLYGEASAKVLKMSPVVAVEPLANLGAHVAQEESLIHSRLGPFRICCRDLVATIVAAAVIVFQISSEFGRDSFILHELAVFAVTVSQRKRSWCDMFDHPLGVS